MDQDRRIFLADVLKLGRTCPRRWPSAFRCPLFRSMYSSTSRLIAACKARRAPSRRMSSIAGPIARPNVNALLSMRRILFCPMWDGGETRTTIHRGYAAFIQLPVIHDFRLYLLSEKND